MTDDEVYETYRGDIELPLHEKPQIPLRLLLDDPVTAIQLAALQCKHRLMLRDQRAQHRRDKKDLKEIMES